jgi:hypothetical protein
VKERRVWIRGSKVWICGSKVLICGSREESIECRNRPNPFMSFRPFVGRPTVCDLSTSASSALGQNCALRRVHGSQHRALASIASIIEVVISRREELLTPVPDIGSFFLIDHLSQLDALGNGFTAP